MKVKIDKSFVLGLADAGDAGDAAIVRAAIDLGHALGLSVVAEGVENLATQRHLARWGCDLVQGFHIARPTPADAFATWLDRREPPAPAEPSDAGAAANP